MTPELPSGRVHVTVTHVSSAGQPIGSVVLVHDLRYLGEREATEAELNALGYQHLQAEDTEKAIAVFRTNLERHPESWNCHDSLGEGLAAAGRTEEAIASYEKALEMAPENQTTRIESILERLRAE